MHLVISNSSSVPIYEQIKKTIINQILEGELDEDELLPSIRVLAQDIKISAMTIKKAYDELEKEGYLKSIQGKGTFVAPKNTEIAKEQAQKDIEDYIEKIALDYQISKEAIYAEINKILYAKENSNKLLEKKSTVVKPKIVNENDENISSSILRRENLVIYLLINYPEEAYQKIKENIKIDDMKLDKNKEILQKLYEELENGNNNTAGILDIFKDDEIISHLSGIMATDFEISEVKKCINDVIISYEKDKLIIKRNEIIKKLENTNELTKDEIANLEKELSELIIKLARIK